MFGIVIRMNFHKIKHIPHSLYFFSVDAKKLEDLLNKQMKFVTLTLTTEEGLRCEEI
jgi:hypothetical protein